MALLNGFDVATGERAFAFGSSYDEKTKGFFDDVWTSPAGQRFRREFRSPEHNLQAVDEAQKRFGDVGYITVSQFSEVLGDLMAGDPDFRPNEDPAVETPAPESAPVHRGQELWREHAEFMRAGGKDGGEPSMAEVRARMAVNRSFRAFVEQAYEREADPTNDPTTKEYADKLHERNPHLAPQEKSGKVTQELAAFAKIFRETPASRLRPIGGFVEVAGQRYPWGEFRSLVEQATAAGLV